MRRLALLGALALVVPAGASAHLQHSNAPSKGATPLSATMMRGRLVSHRCAHRTIVHNDRGACVKALSYLLTGADPAWRPKYARQKGQHGANVDGRYWRFRSDMTSHAGKGLIHEIQLAKFRLGYPAGAAIGAAGPKFRAYLLGRPLPAKYVDAKENRYQAWRKAHAGPGPRVKHLMELAYQAIAWHDHYYYTQSPHRSDFLAGLGPPWPKGGDCSGSADALLFLSFGHRISTGPFYPYDWTGSMQSAGRVVWRAGQSITRLHKGDLVFYGPPPNYGHVAIYLGSGRVYSFGHTGCPCNASLLYRDDARIARRYF